MPVDVTEDYVRIRIREPGLFKDDSFRTIVFSNDQGIHAIIGHFKDDDGDTHVQSLLFEKEKWTASEAESWVQSHRNELKHFETSAIHKVACPSEWRTVEEPQGRFIEGFASTDAVDWYKEIIDPEAFRLHLPEYEKFPILLVNHVWTSLPIGKVVKAEIQKRGLWVRAFISETADNVWKLIQEDILKAFSVRFHGVRREDKDDSPSIWREVALLEISIVNVPANTEALFAQAKQRGISLDGIITRTRSPKGGAEMPDITLEQVKATAAEEAKALGPSLVAEATTAMKKEVESITVQVNDAKSIIAEVKRNTANCLTKEEAQGIVNKALEPLSAALAANDRLAHKGLGSLAQGPPLGGGIRYKARWLADLIDTINRPPDYVRTMALRAEEQTDHGDLQKQIKELQRLHDEVLIVDAMVRARNPHGYMGIRSLKIFGDYDRLANEYAKAMSTGGTLTGAEWVPTMMSAEMVDKITLEAKIAPAIRQFAMPTKVYEWPTRTSWGTVYIATEASTDTPAKLKASTPGTNKVTFTAKVGAVRNLLSAEQTEDSIVPALPDIMDGMAKAFAHGLDDAILNGDDAATHQDSDVTDDADWRKVWDGLRLIALAVAGSKAAATSATVANVGAIWKLMGMYGADPSKLLLILSARDRAQLMIDANVVTVANYGPDRATIVKGELPAILGMPVVASAESRVNLNATGVYDGSTVTKSAAIIVNTESFKLGNRRQVTLEVDKDIETQQYIVVGTWRGDFKQMRAATANDFPVVIGYNMA